MSIIDSLKETANNLASNPTVKQAVDFVKSDEGKKKILEAKDKVEDFVEEKTDGKGIFGFGKKD